MPRIDEIDKNLAIKANISGTDVVFKNALSAPFDLYGVLGAEPFTRFPIEVGKNTSDGVDALNYHTAGGRLRFKTNSKHIAIRAKMNGKCLMSHMPFCGSAGFDMYSFDGSVYKYEGTFMPDVNRGESYESIIYLPDNNGCDITINFPLYNGVTELLIGLEPSAELTAGESYIDLKPIVFYGSSITQGGCASRPGNSYQGIISRRFNCDYLNLGFSGSAKGEQAMSDYIAGLDSSLFFMDYDHNAPTAEHLDKTHEALFLNVREKHPDMPIIIATKTDIPRNTPAEKETDARKKVIYKTYENAIRRGDKYVRFIDGGDVFKQVLKLSAMPDSCTVDGCHPNDLGFACMAKVFGDEIADMLGLK